MLDYEIVFYPLKNLFNKNQCIHETALLLSEIFQIAEVSKGVFVPVYASSFYVKEEVLYFTVSLKVPVFQTGENIVMEKLFEK